jgi:hypothetical protein
VAAHVRTGEGVILRQLRGAITAEEVYGAAIAGRYISVQIDRLDGENERIPGYDREADGITSACKMLT